MRIPSAYPKKPTKGKNPKIANDLFANIRNNPGLQEKSFTPVSARSLQSIWRSGWTSAAEISVLSTEQ